MISINNVPDNTLVLAFNLGGVIFENIPETQAYILISKKYGVDIESIFGLLEPKYEMFFQGRIGEDKYWEPLVLKYNIPLSLCKKSYRSAVKPIPQMFDFLKRVYRKYPCYTLNNEAKEWMDYRIKKFNLKKYLKGFITSAYFGVEKPDPRIYQIFLETVKTKPDQILFIDNDRENLTTAKRMGIKTYLFPD